MDNTSIPHTIKVVKAKNVVLNSTIYEPWSFYDTRKLARTLVETIFDKSLNRAI